MLRQSFQDTYGILFSIESRQYKISHGILYRNPSFYLLSQSKYHYADRIGMNFSEKVLKAIRISCGKDKRDYNNNENEVLTNAIAKGARGAYWHILKNVQ